MEPLGFMHEPADVPVSAAGSVEVQEGMSYEGQDEGQAQVMRNYQQGMQGANDDQYNGVDGFRPQQWQGNMAPGMPGFFPPWQQPHGPHNPYAAMMAQHDMEMLEAAFGGPPMMPGMIMPGILGNGGGGFLPLPFQMDGRSMSHPGAGQFPMAGGRWSSGGGNGISIGGGSGGGWGSSAAGGGQVQAGRRGSMTGEGALVPLVEAKLGVSGPVDLLGYPVGPVVGPGADMKGGAKAGEKQQQQQADVDAVSGYEMEGCKVVVTADRSALQAVLWFLNG